MDISFSDAVLKYDAQEIIWFYLYKAITPQQFSQGIFI